MPISLGTRQKTYENSYDSRIISRVPVIIRVDGRAFHSVTKKLERPFCPKLLDIMADTLLESIKQIDGAVFGYQQSDELTFILKNDKSLDTEPWFSNRIQKIASVTASIVTYEFNKKFHSLQDKPNLIGRPIFDARVFAVPNLIEAINNLIWRQQDCMKNSVTAAARYELSKELGRKTADKLLHKKNSTERETLLREKCEITFKDHYPSEYRLGLGVYRVPFLIDDTDVLRHKWIIDKNLPVFSENKDFVRSILESGKDIFRADRDL